MSSGAEVFFLTLRKKNLVLSLMYRHGSRLETAQNEQLLASEEKEVHQDYVSLVQRWKGTVQIVFALN